VIRSWADAGIEDLFNGLDPRRARRTCPPALGPGTRRKLDQLNRVRTLQELKVPPGNRLERLRGDRLGQYSIRINEQYRYVSAGRTAMPRKWRSRITTKRGAAKPLIERRLPAHRPPTHPGEMLLEEFLRPLGITQSAFAVRLGVSFPRLNEIINRKRAVTPDTVLRLARVTGMSADFWLGLQQDWDLWHALRSDAAADIEELEPPEHSQHR